MAEYERVMFILMPFRREFGAVREALKQVFCRLKRPVGLGLARPGRSPGLVLPVSGPLSLGPVRLHARRQWAGTAYDGAT